METSDLFIREPNEPLEEPEDNFDCYRLPDEPQPSQAAKLQAKEKFFKGPLVKEDLAKLRPEIEIDGSEVNFHLGVSFDKTLAEENFLKRLDEALSDRVTAIKRYINTNGRKPTEVLREAANDPTKVSFFGEEHESGASDMLLSVLSEASPTAIFAPEFPAALRPLFEQYNRSPKDTKFTLPDNLDELVGKEAAAYCHFNEAIIESTPLFEAAHKRGVKIIPIDDSEVMSVMDAVSKLKVDPENPGLHQKQVLKVISQFTRGGAKNPDREAKIQENLLALIKEFPDSPILAQMGRTHAAENTPEEWPASKLLAHSAEFKRTGKEVVSFASFSLDAQFGQSSLSSFAKELDHPVCFPTKDKDGKSPLTNMYELQGVNTDFFDAYDYVILSTSNSAGGLPKADKTLPTIELSGSFLKEGVTAAQRESFGNIFRPGKEEFETIRKLYEESGIVAAELESLIEAMNQEGQDPNKTLAEMITNPRVLLLIDNRAFGIDSVRGDLNRSPGALSSSLLAKTMEDLPPGSSLALDIPLMFKPLLDRFNKSPRDTSFSLQNEDNAILFQEAGFADPHVLKVLETAHKRGIDIILFGSNTEQRESDPPEVLERTNTEYAQAISTIAAARPNAPLVVLYLRESHSQQVAQKLTNDPEFRTSGRAIEKIGVVGVGYDTLAPLSASLDRPISLDLSKPSLTNLASRYLDTKRIMQTSSYNDYFAIMKDRLGKIYDHIIMLPSDRR